MRRALVFVSILLLLGAAAPTDGKKKPNPAAFEGKILFVDPMSYMCDVNAGGFSSRVVLGPGSKLTSNGKPIDFSDLKSGHKVRLVTTASSSRILINTLDVLEPVVARTKPVPKPVLYTVQGQVQSFDPFAQRLVVSAKGNTYFLDMSQGTPFKDPEMGASKLTSGRKVSLTLQNFGVTRTEIINIDVVPE